MSLWSYFVRKDKSSLAHKIKKPVTWSKASEWVRHAEGRERGGKQGVERSVVQIYAFFECTLTPLV